MRTITFLFIFIFHILVPNYLLIQSSHAQQLPDQQFPGQQYNPAGLHKSDRTRHYSSNTTLVANGQKEKETVNNA